MVVFNAKLGTKISQVMMSILAMQQCLLHYTISTKNSASV